jgi:excinuclease UvrABC nuclease subunit
VARLAFKPHKPVGGADGFDISNTQGTAIFASQFCFVDRRAAKEHYRHYIIQTMTGTADDFTWARIAPSRVQLTAPRQRRVLQVLARHSGTDIVILPMVPVDGIRLESLSLP